MLESDSTQIYYFINNPHIRWQYNKYLGILFSVQQLRKGLFHRLLERYPFNPQVLLNATEDVNKPEGTHNGE